MRNRNNQVLIRLTDSELCELQKKIDSTGLAREAYIRALINGLIPKEAPCPDYMKMMKQLRSIGNSMNQIAARANSIGFINAEDYQQCAQELWNTLLEIQNTFLPEKIHGND